MTCNGWRVGGLGLACLAIFISGMQASGLEVRLVPAQPGPPQDAEHEGFRGTLHFQPTGGADLDDTEPRTVALEGTDRVLLDLPPDTWWTVEPEIEGWWSGPVAISTKATLATLDLHPAGHAEIELASGAALAPDRVTARFARSLQGVPVVPGQAQEEIQGMFQFEDLKPGSYEIELTAPGWSTTDRGAVRVLPGRETEAG